MEKVGRFHEIIFTLNEQINELTNLQFYTDVSLLLRAIQGRLKEFNPDNAVQKNIKHIIMICNKKYADKNAHGDAVLNRGILLDEEIALLLTPDTLLAILAMDAAEKTRKKIAIKRGDGTITIADAIYSGFKQGLDVIHSMPCNEHIYGQVQHKQHVNNFETNTMRTLEISVLLHQAEYGNSSTVKQL